MFNRQKYKSVYDLNDNKCYKEKSVARIRREPKIEQWSRVQHAGVWKRPLEEVI